MVTRTKLAVMSSQHVSALTEARKSFTPTAVQETAISSYFQNAGLQAEQKDGKLWISVWSPTDIRRMFGVFNSLLPVYTQLTEDDLVKEDEYVYSIDLEKIKYPESKPDHQNPENVSESAAKKKSGLNEAVATAWLPCGTTVQVDGTVDELLAIVNAGGLDPNGMRPTPMESRKTEAMEPVSGDFESWKSACLKYAKDHGLELDFRTSSEGDSAGNARNTGDTFAYIRGQHSYVGKWYAGNNYGEVKTESRRSVRPVTEDAPAWMDEDDYTHLRVARDDGRSFDWVMDNYPHLSLNDAHREWINKFLQGKTESGFLNPEEWRDSVRKQYPDAKFFVDNRGDRSEKAFIDTPEGRKIVATQDRMGYAKTESRPRYKDDEPDLVELTGAESKRLKAVAKGQLSAALYFNMDTEVESINRDLVGKDREMGDLIPWKAGLHVPRNGTVTVYQTHSGELQDAFEVRFVDGRIDKVITDRGREIQIESVKSESIVSDTFADLNEYDVDTLRDSVSDFDPSKTRNLKTKEEFIDFLMTDEFGKDWKSKMNESADTLESIAESLKEDGIKYDDEKQWRSAINVLNRKSDGTLNIDDHDGGIEVTDQTGNVVGIWLKSNYVGYVYEGVKSESSMYSSRRDWEDTMKAAGATIGQPDSDGVISATLPDGSLGGQWHTGYNEGIVFDGFSESVGSLETLIK